MKRLLFIAATAATLMTALPAAATNLLVNGGFETPGDPTGAAVVVRPGQEPAGFGWSVTEGSVDVHATNGPFGGDPDPVGAGASALDLIGLGDTGGIAQSFATRVGAIYRLTFDFANNPFAPSAALKFGVRGASGDLFSQSATHSGSILTAMDWTSFTYEFTAADSLSTLFFTNTAGIRDGGIYLDNVSVAYVSGGAVPEPATWALMISGFGLAGAALRQRRRLAPTAG